MDASTTIDEYIHSFPEDVQQRLHTLSELIKEEAPEAVEAFSYQLDFRVGNPNQ